MNSNNLVILGFCIFLILSISSAIIITVLSPEETNLDVLSNSSMYSGENFTVKLTSDDKPLANQNIVVTFKDADGNLTSINLTTNEKGIATGIQNLSAGNYTVNVTYSGNEDYKSSNLTTNLKIEAKATLLASSQQSQSAYSSYGVPKDMPLFRGDGPSDPCAIGQVGYDLSSCHYYRYLGDNNYELVA